MPALNIADRFRLLGKAAVGVFSESAQHEAYGMLSGIQPGGLGQPPVRGTQQFLEAYSQMPWLRAVAARVAGAVAQTEWHLYVEKKKGAQRATRNMVIQRAGPTNRRKMLKTASDRGDATQIDNHVLLDTITNANSFQTGDSFWKVTQLHLDLVGEAFWLKERDGLGTVVGLWPVPPHWVMNTPTPVNPSFRVGFRSWRGLIPDTEFIWFADPNPANPYGRGSGTAQALADELETDEYAAKHVRAFFYNRAKPDILVYPKAPSTMRTADVARLEEDWTNRNAGFWRAFKPYFLTREVGVHEMDQNLRAQQFVQLREFERNAIIQMFGMPPELLGVVENSNRATIEAADYLFSRYVVQPRLEFIRAVMQERLVPEYDERLIIDYVSPVQDDKELELKAAQAAPFAPTLDEWREKMGLPPLGDTKGGNVHVFPNTSKPFAIQDAIDSALEPPDPVLPPGQPGGPQDGSDGDGAPKPAKPPKPAGEAPAGDGGKAWRKAVREDAAICTAAGDPEAASDLSVHAVAEDDEPALPLPTAAAGRMERPFARALVRFWTDARESVDLDALASACASGDHENATHLLNGPATEDGLPEVCEPRMAAAFMRGAELGLDVVRTATAHKDGEPQLDMDFRAMNEEAARFARRYAFDLIAAPAAVREVIARLVMQSVAAGVAPRDLARMLRSVIGLTSRQAQALNNFRQRLIDQGVGGDVLSRRVERYSEALIRQRALTIARTELIRAVNAGQQALWQRDAHLLPNMRRIWIVTDDERLEPECEALGEQDPVGLNEPFSPGVMAPPLHPNCRCAIGLVDAAGDEV